MEITHWTIKITWNDKKEEYIADIPDWVAKNVDEYLSELEHGRKLQEYLADEEFHDLKADEALEDEESLNEENNETK